MLKNKFPISFFQFQPTIGSRNIFSFGIGYSKPVKDRLYRNRVPIEVSGRQIIQKY